MSDTVSIQLPDPDATSRLGATLAEVLIPGDCVCLSGDLGAGKSHLARATIQSLQAKFGPVEDVPSPTYTLVQTYRAGPLSILHADLYRLGDPEELEELGLEGALAHSISLIEWPDRLGHLTPGQALWIELHHDGDGRRAVLRGAGWQSRLIVMKPVADA